MSNSSSDERPSKTLKIANASSPCGYILSFTNNENSPAPPTLDFGLTLKPQAKAVIVNPQKKEPRRNVQEGGEKTRSPHHAQDHIIAERKRREKISQKFIALSALIPGLKKMDKVSILEDAIQHMKQLQEQVKELQEEKTKRKSAESVVYVEKSKSSVEEEDDVSLPEIEARVSENKVLIRIHCEKQEGVLMNILREIGNLHLSVINTLLFGSSKLDITIIAEMDDEFRLSMKDLARKLRVRLLQLI